MRCISCGSENREGVQFCENCGAKMERACPACGTVVSPEARFCGACGHRIAQDAATPAQSPALKSERPERYTPSHLAERIRGSRGALEGERKQVTILFADLKGSLEMIEGADPEHTQAILDSAVGAMMDAVHRYEGTVNKVLGDGIMALFGAPLAHEDHAVRACYAALTLQKEMQAVAAETRRKHGIEAQVRIGLHSGEVVVRSIGNDLSMDYDAIGPSVHIAGRMEQLATPGSTRISAETFRLAEGFVEVAALGPVPVKGLEAPIEVYQLTGAGAARTRLQAAAARGLTRFVGRDAEIQALNESLQRSGEGQGQIVSVVGEAGVGKSRLFYEFTRSHRVEGGLVLENSSVSYGKASPWHPVVDLLKGYFGIEDEDDARRVAEKVAGKLVMLDDALRSLLSPLLTLLGVAVDDAEWNGLEASDRRTRMLESVKRLLLRESRVQPLILVFEDLHWIDGETQALLDSLVASLPTSRILLLANYRPEYKHGWGGRTYYKQLRIDPLAAAGAKELTAALIGDDPGLDDLKRLLIERTEGNPLFLEESVRTLVETGVLVGGRGAYRMEGKIEAIEVPATVQAILAARIDRLAPAAKHLLQCAAIIGHHVAYPVLAAVAETEEAALRRCLAELQEGEFVYEAQLFPELMYVFKHALTHEITYHGVLQDRRRALHRRAGDAISDVYPDRRMENFMAIISHYERAEAWEKAARLQLAW
ncbi:MAG: AAA family ATPase [Kiloniellales bacterium]